MNAADVVGYTADADVYCEDCAHRKYGTNDDVLPDTREYNDLTSAYDREGNRLHAMFVGDEADTPQHCCECGELLPTNLTSDGWQYVKEAVLDYFENGRGSREGLSEWLNEWPVECGFCGGLIHGLGGVCLSHDKTGIIHLECFEEDEFHSGLKGEG